MISSQLNEMKTELKNLGGLKDLPSKFESFENQLSDILNEITTIGSNMDHLKEENAQLNKRNRDLEEKNAKLDSQLNEIEQYGRRQNLEIHGIPMPDNETNAEVEEKVLQVLKSIDTTITKYAINVVHRLRGKPKTDQNKTCPGIILRFIDKKNRNNIYSSRKRLKSAEFDDPRINRVFINENLTSGKKNTYLLKPIKKQKIYIGNICGLTMGGSISEKMKMMQSLPSKQKTTYIVSSNMFYDSGFMRLSCGGELLSCLLLAFTLFTNASLMTSFTLPSHPNGCVLFGIILFSFSVTRASAFLLHAVKCLAIVCDVALLLCASSFVQKSLFS